MARPSKSEIAWAAGLYEGEGSVVLTEWGSIKLQVRMTDEDVLEHLRTVLGGLINGPYQYNVEGRPPRKPFWIWSVTGPNADRACRLLEPWLGKRRRGRMEQLGAFAQRQFDLEDGLGLDDSEEDDLGPMA
jgi:hypothetical protein